MQKIHLDLNRRFAAVRSAICNARPHDIFLWVSGILVVGLAATLRLSGLDDFSLTLDESTLRVFADAIRQDGYPHVRVGTMEVPLATYELVPYFVALATSLFGANDFAVRLPSALFGTATSYLIFTSALRWFDWRVALISGLLYATSPWTIYWGQSAFHPAQMQFFALLTIVQAQALFSSDSPQPKLYYLAALYFSCAYLSWEGIGFLLPILVLMALLMRWGDWAWFRIRHLWIAGGIIAAVVLAQGVRRALLVDSYLLVGSGRGDVSMPEIVFTKPYYIPFFYVEQVFTRYNHVVLTTLFIAGFLFIFRNANLKFTHLLTIVATLFMANFLGYYSGHYIYYIAPIYFISVAASLVMLADAMTPKLEPALRSPLWIGRVLWVMLAVLAIGSSANLGFKIWEISASAKEPNRADARADIAVIDYRGIIEEMRKRWQPGDVIINFAPFSLRTYAHMDGDYFIQNYTMQKVVYDPGAGEPYYIEKYAGKPTLRTLEEFQDMLHRHPRVWLVAAPYKPMTDILDKATLGYIDNNMTLIAESYDAKLYLSNR